MSPKERKLLEDKRQQLHNEQMAAIAKANQATGAISMIDSILALPDEKPEDMTRTEAPKANGADHSEAQSAG